MCMCECFKKKTFSETSMASFGIMKIMIVNSQQKTLTDVRAASYIVDTTAICIREELKKR